MRRCFVYEDDISAEEAAEEEGSRIQSQDAHEGRKEGIGSKACKRQEKIIRIVYRSQTM